MPHEVLLLWPSTWPPPYLPVTFPRPTSSSTSLASTGTVPDSTSAPFAAHNSDGKIGAQGETRESEKANGDRETHV
jgi:hypothetical protein